jgi:hypothetical protein
MGAIRPFLQGKCSLFGQKDHAKLLDQQNYWDLNLRYGESVDLTRKKRPGISAWSLFLRYVLKVRT